MQPDVLESWLRAMRSGDFAAAWQLSDLVLASGAGVWDGTPLHDRRVLVRCDHGLGDTIQFARYLEAVERIASEVLSTVRGANHGGPEVDYDIDVEIMELPHVFRTTVDTIPATVPYVHVAPAVRVASELRASARREGRAASPAARSSARSRG